MRNGGALPQHPRMNVSPCSEFPDTPRADAILGVSDVRSEEDILDGRSRTSLDGRIKLRRARIEEEWSRQVAAQARGQPWSNEEMRRRELEVRANLARVPSTVARDMSLEQRMRDIRERNVRRRVGEIEEQMQASASADYDDIARERNVRRRVGETEEQMQESAPAQYDDFIDRMECLGVKRGSEEWEFY